MNTTAVAALCGVVLLSAAAVVLPRRPVRCAMALLVHSLSLAALYAALGADFVGMAQLLIYSGAIVVVFLFVVLLLPKGGREARQGPRRTAAALVGGGAFIAAFAATVVAQLPVVDVAPPDAPALARALFDPLLRAFELTAPLLLVAIVGAVTLWRRQESSEP